MPSASVRMTTAVKPGALASVRRSVAEIVEHRSVGCGIGGRAVVRESVFAGGVPEGRRFCKEQMGNSKIVAWNARPDWAHRRWESSFPHLGRDQATGFPAEAEKTGWGEAATGSFLFLRCWRVQSDATMMHLQLVKFPGHVILPEYSRVHSACFFLVPVSSGRKHRK